MRIEITGAIVTELFDTKNGGKRFNLARSEYKKNGNVFEEKYKMFFTVFVTDKRNLDILDGISLQTGQRMWISGEFDANEYTDKTGALKTSYTIFAERICVYPKGQKNGLDKYKKSSGRSYAAKDDVDDSIPF